MKLTDHYIVGNRYEGCGHRHRSVETARKCLRRLPDIIGFRTSVYRITYLDGKRRWERMRMSR